MNIVAVANTRVGAKISISIGRKGERPDLYPARIVGLPQMVPNNGRMQEVAKVIVDQTNLAGEHYLAERIHNLAFAYDRQEPCELLDGPATQPKTWQELVAERTQSALAFVMGLPETGQSVEADQLAI